MSASAGLLRMHSLVFAQAWMQISGTGKGALFSLAASPGHWLHSSSTWPKLRVVFNLIPGLRDPWQPEALSNGKGAKDMGKHDVHPSQGIPMDNGLVIQGVQLLHMLPSFLSLASACMCKAANNNNNKHSQNVFFQKWWVSLKEKNNIAFLQTS